MCLPFAGNLAQIASPLMGYDAATGCFEPHLNRFVTNFLHLLEACVVPEPGASISSFLFGVLLAERISWEAYLMCRLACCLFCHS